MVDKTQHIALVALSLVAVISVASVGVIAVTGASINNPGKAGEQGRWAGDWCRLTTPQGKSVSVPCDPKEDFPGEQAAVAVCGDGVCEFSMGETSRSCPEDCGSTGPVCGNGICEKGETRTCPKDCLIIIPVEGPLGLE